jgi:drug/metabolite transporter (DMT)-like permease
MTWKEGFSRPGVPAALGAALLFGTGTPVAKWLLDAVSPWLLAGLLYLGSGIGLALYRRITRAPAVRLARNEVLWFAGAIFFGGIVGPVLLMFGLSGMPASGASLLMNAEGVFTALLAWFAFKENFDRRIALGMVAIVTGAAIISWPGEARFAGLWPMLAVLGACLAWGVDNNLTRRISLTDATWVAAAKGLVSGAVNLALAFALGATLPSLQNAAAAMLVGLLAYGVSLTLFVIGLRHLGTARTGAYFSVAPFFGALLALLMGEPLTLPLLAAGILMALGTWLHLTEHHGHAHVHLTMMHDHEHIHDEHHRHAHDTPMPSGSKHRHLHQHEPLRHTHPHFPDTHHRHNH